MKKTTIALLAAITLSVSSASAQPYFRHGAQPRGTTRVVVDNRRGYYDAPYGFVTPYKGFLEAGYAAGVSNNRADQFDILTTHGVQATPNVFVGIGSGLNILFNKVNDNSPAHYDGSDYHTTGVNIPLYLALRLTPDLMRSYSPIQPYFDLKVGASFMVSDDVLAIGDGYLDSRRNFYMSPSIGVRIPTGFKSALNLALAYNLTTQQYADWGRQPSSCGLSSLGVRVAYEW